MTVSLIIGLSLEGCSHDGKMTEGMFEVFWDAVAKKKVISVYYEDVTTCYNLMYAYNKVSDEWSVIVSDLMDRHNKKVSYTYYKDWEYELGTPIFEVEEKLDCGHKEGYKRLPQDVLADRLYFQLHNTWGVLPIEIAVEEMERCYLKLKEGKEPCELRLAVGRGLKGAMRNKELAIKQIAEEIDKVCTVAHWEHYLDYTKAINR